MIRLSMSEPELEVREGGLLAGLLAEAEEDTRWRMEKAVERSAGEGPRRPISSKTAREWTHHRELEGKEGEREREGGEGGTGNVREEGRDHG